MKREDFSFKRGCCLLCSICRHTRLSACTQSARAPLGSHSWDVERCTVGRISHSHLYLCLQVPFICSFFILNVLILIFNILPNNATNQQVNADLYSPNLLILFVHSALSSRRRFYVLQIKNIPELVDGFDVCPQGPQIWPIHTSVCFWEQPRLNSYAVILNSIFSLVFSASCWNLSIVRPSVSFGKSAWLGLSLLTWDMHQCPIVAPEKADFHKCEFQQELSKNYQLAEKRRVKDKRRTDHPNELKHGYTMFQKHLQIVNDAITTTNKNTSGFMFHSAR